MFGIPMSNRTFSRVGQTIICDTGSGFLNYEVIDLTPPWRERVDTLVFCHGVGIDSNV